MANQHECLHEEELESMADTVKKIYEMMCVAINDAPPFSVRLRSLEDAFLKHKQEHADAAAARRRICLAVALPLLVMLAGALMWFALRGGLAPIVP